MIPRGDGDGWTYCAQGHKHWGIHGAAGLLLRYSDPAGGDQVLLQHRALWSHHGGTWGILGGARNSGETPVHTAAREAAEEAGFGPERYSVVGEHVDDHGGWSYTTIVGHADSALALTALTAETIISTFMSASRPRAASSPSAAMSTSARASAPLSPR